jgi:hypothetical protein
MWKTLTLVFGSLLIVISLVFGYFFINGVTSKSADNRRIIPLTPVEKDLVLGEMRSMLKAVNGIIDALAKNDMLKAADSARSAGMAMAVDANPILMAKLPLDFKQLGMGTHAQFDELAAQIKAGATQELILQRLSTITNRCVACHDGNRIGMRDLNPKIEVSLFADHGFSYSLQAKK